MLRICCKILAKQIGEFMSDNVRLKMKNAVRVFKRNAENSDSGWLLDNYYILERHAVQAAESCKYAQKLLKGSDSLPGLFMHCRALCKKGVLPAEDEIIEYFRRKPINGIAATYLPLAFTCALIDVSAEGVKSGEKSGTKMLAQAIASLRRMAETDFDYIAEKLCSAESILMNDPDGVYPLMDSESKNRYRYLVALKAKREGKSEKEVAEEALKKARDNSSHIGKYIVGGRKSRRGYVYLVMDLIMPLAVSFAAAVLFMNPWVGALLFFPVWELLRYPIENASMKGVAPKRFFRLSADNERVLNAHTLITVSTLLPSAVKMHELEKHLEQIYLSNCVGNIKVCCLADFKGADSPSRPEDKAVIKSAKEAADRLNAKYGGGFVFAIRPRVYSKTQEQFIGRERKRGAITELIRAIKGNQKGFAELYGDTEHLAEVKYLIALDADTQLVFDSARELVAIAEHPLNYPVIKNGRVLSGYGILVPKAENRLNSEKTTLFERIMAGDTGITAYDSVTGERYQDLFGESIFSGKGLINVDAFYKLLDSGLPNETILSHDIVEGSYLRAGYVPEVQVTESFPDNAGAFYSRLHRWVRGDWQNIGFIFGKNPLNFLSRYKMADNLRRSLTSALCFAALFGSLVIQGDAGVFVACVAMFALGARNFYAGFNWLINSGFSAMTGLYFSKALPGALGCFARAFVSIAYSARESYVCISAAAVALWRLLVSRKNLLEWITAAQAEKTESKTKLLVSCIPAVISAVLFMLYGLPIHRLIGLIIIADIPLTLFGGKKTKRKNINISENQKDSLLSYASAMWGFFSDLCGKSNNFLPPDNIQFSPERAVANRTSPTNIGLMLTSFLAARDFGFITSAELYMRLNLSFGTIKKLEKHKGNLLNWYDTVTLEPLNPRFVSAVDSGNFLCCLTALKEGLREYVPECPSLKTIIDKAEKIISETDLAIMYNEKRQLFYIGISPDDGIKSQSYYDLYMSEMRMTAYLAVARRVVPKKHWGAMGRILVSQGRYTGLVSWTGTMFEYFMPNLFIPAPEGSLSRESLLFCLLCQRKKAGKLPFGVSESGFYAFDGALNYQYKAHGVQKLGLRRGMDKENVVSPYSSFLTLTIAPRISLKNLSKLASMGMTGKYGFFEAVDFTKGRNSGDYSVVHSYMAHHVGMSFLSVANLLKDNCMQRRFMSDGFMQGAKSLLEEKVQTGSKVFKDIRTEETRHVREKTQSKNTVSVDPSPFSPKATLFSNGRMTTCITDSGTGVSLFDGVDVTVNSSELFIRPQGVYAVFVTEKNRISFTKAIDKGSDTKYTAEFFKNRAVHTSESKNMRLSTETSLLKHRNCETRKFTLENTSNKDISKGKLIVYFEPCIEKRAVYGAHPAFSKLFLLDEWDEENKCCIFTRNGREEEARCAVVAGFAEKCNLKHETNREKVLKTPDGVFSLGLKTDFKGDRGNPDCCCSFSVDIELEPREKKTLQFMIAAESGKEDALNTFLKVRADKNKTKAENPFYSDSLGNAVSAILLPKILYEKSGVQPTKLNEKCNFKKEDLWSFGISGDLPIIMLEVNDTEQAETVLPYIRLNKILRSCGVQTDLVIVCRNDEGYFSPLASMVKKILLQENCTLMEGVKGGVHIVDFASQSYSQVCALRAKSIRNENLSLKSVDDSEIKFKSLKIHSDHKVPKNSSSVKKFNFTEGKIQIKNTAKTVDIPWCMVYANQSFGTMVSDKSIGFTWAINSRENKLTPWYNDTMSDNRGEALFLKYNGVLYDIAALGTAEFMPEKATWLTEITGLQIRTEITVPQKGMTKRCTVTITNESKVKRDFDLMYFMLPVLGVSREKTGNLFARKTDNGIILKNSDSEIPGYSSLICNEMPDYFCYSVKDFFEGNYSASTDDISSDCCISIGKKISLGADEEKTLIFYLSWAASENAALIMPKVSKFSKRLLCPAKIKTSDEKLNLFFNSFLYSQVKQSRFWGRTGFYQCSGAYGFRDQLQDCLAFIDFEPKLTLTHIYRCAAVQFIEGDVLHWWHVLVDKRQKIQGVRTKCSDDMLWLPYSCVLYWRKTGDLTFLECEIPYINGPLLSENEKERYIVSQRTKLKESLFEHCLKAVDYSLNFGKNGLPLIGSCDWNDGFSNMQGAESVWLAMFQKIVLEDMAELCKEFGMNKKSEEYALIAKKLVAAIDEKAWMGDRYGRAIFKSGELLGAEKGFIDILPQAFAAIADIGTEERQNKALSTAMKLLFDEQTGVIRLLSPPFLQEERGNIGYIVSYPAGLRENSGQYTHAAVWLLWALLKKERYNEAEKLLSAINPLHFYDNPETAAKYRAEPFVLAGDVSYGNEISGRAGWTHFTGSAAWFYRCIVKYENVLKKINNNSVDASKNGGKAQELDKSENWSVSLENNEKSEK